MRSLDGGLEELVGTSGLTIEAPNAEAEQPRSATIAWQRSNPVREARLEAVDPLSDPLRVDGLFDA
jgi:hypothetical protein